MPSLEQDPDSELEQLVGTTVAGKYRVDRLIGRGGMGAVFQATNLVIGKRVALKFLDQESAKNREATLRFQREAEAAGMAESAHIVQIFDSGVSEVGLPFLVMELLTGEDLRGLLRRQHRIEPAPALRIAAQVLRALVRAHAAGIVHRDLKPDNVFLCARDDDPAFVKIVDFGISKVARARVADTLTRRGTVLGTAFYMSPEQAQSFADIDGRTDLFSLGAILFEMLTGGPPHVAPTYEAVLIAICTHDAADVRDRVPEVPEPVARLVQKALARDRELRFQSATEFLDAIASIEAELGFAPPSSSLSNSKVRTRPLNPRPPRAYGTLVAGIVATLCGFALTAYLLSRGGPAPRDTASPLVASAIAVPVRTPDVTPGPSLTPPAVTAKALPNPALPAHAAGGTKGHHSGTAKPGAGTVGGLQLSTKEP